MSQDDYSKLIEDFQRAGTTLRKLKTEKDWIASQVQEERLIREKLEVELEAVKTERDRLSSANTRLRQEIRGLKQSIQSRLEQIDCDEDCCSSPKDLAQNQDKTAVASSLPQIKLEKLEATEYTVGTGQIVQRKSSDKAEVPVNVNNVQLQQKTIPIATATSHEPQIRVEADKDVDLIEASKPVSEGTLTKGNSSASAPIGSSSPSNQMASASLVPDKERDIRNAALRLFNMHPDWATDALLEAVRIQVIHSQGQLDMDAFTKLQREGKLKNMLQQALYRFKRKMVSQIIESKSFAFHKDDRDDVAAKAKSSASNSPRSVLSSTVEQSESCNGVEPSAKKSKTETPSTANSLMDAAGSSNASPINLVIGSPLRLDNTNTLVRRPKADESSSVRSRVQP